ncbi:MAG TPA: RNA polymerase sigma-70 factor [Vicinamibacterales bacterium]|nr:RNA polymerase sigma-70 factor [Vicinamibacterales bacterium]
MSELDDFERYRTRLFALAYRMLGSAAEAEDVVQDAWLRYAGAQRSDLRSPLAYLTTIVTRLALDRLKSARTTREQYVGPWLPEPVLTEGTPEPERSAALAESLTLAFMVLLDTLSPEERAVFILREAFEYSYAEIATILATSEPNCRQLFHRAKEHLASKQQRSSRSRQEKRKLAERFVEAMRAGDGAKLTRVLADDVGFWGDGGGRLVAAKRPVLGRDAVINLLLGIRRTAPAAGVPLDRISLDVVEVNYEPAMLVRVDGRLDSVYVCSIVDDTIAGIRVVRNPDKLVYIGRQLATGGALVEPPPIYGSSR